MDRRCVWREISNRFRLKRRRLRKLLLLTLRTHEQLAAHRQVFPEGQFVAVAGERVVGMAASLIVFWDDYDFEASWRDFTGGGTFANHDPEQGRTLYAAEVMVDPIGEVAVLEVACTRRGGSSQCVWGCGVFVLVPGCAGITVTRVS